MITEVRFSAIANQGNRPPLASVSFRSRVVTRMVGNHFSCYYELLFIDIILGCLVLPLERCLCVKWRLFFLSSGIIKFKGKTLPDCSQLRSDQICFFFVKLIAKGVFLF